METSLLPDMFFNAIVYHNTDGSLSFRIRQIYFDTYNFDIQAKGHSLIKSWNSWDFCLES
jgi:hypothetical protein